MALQKTATKKENTMKHFIKISLFLAFLITTLQAQMLHKSFTQDGFNITLSSLQPLHVGDNALQIKIQNTQKAKIKVRIFMPAMPGMPAMQNIAYAKQRSDGSYKANVNLSMHGTWQVYLYIIAPHGKHLLIKSFLNF
jgi:hypothetical protein